MQVENPNDKMEVENPNVKMEVEPDNNVKVKNPDNNNSWSSLPVKKRLRDESTTEEGNKGKYSVKPLKKRKVAILSRQEQLEMFKKYEDPLLLLNYNKNPDKCNFVNMVNFNSGVMAGGGFETFENMNEIDEEIKDIFITGNCLTTEVVSGTRKKKKIEKKLDIKPFEDFLHGRANISEDCYGKVFNLIRKMYEKWTLPKNICSVNTYLNCYKGFNVRLIPYLIKLVNTKLDNPTTIKKIIKDRVENSQKTPGLIYTYFKRGDYNLIPLIDSKEYKKPNVHDYEFHDIFNEAIENDNPIYLIKMVSIKTTNIGSLSQFGDHQFMILTFRGKDEKNYWIGTGGGYTADEIDYLVYSIDHAGWNNFNIKSPKNHYVYPNGVLMITEEEERYALRQAFVKFYNDSGKKQAKFVKDSTFGKGITPMKNNQPVSYQKIISTCTPKGDNCATYVSKIFDSVKNVIKDTGRIIEPTVHLNISARLVSFFYSMPNTGKIIDTQKIKHIFETKMTALQGQTTFAATDEEKYYDYLKQLQTDAKKCGIETFQNDLIKYIENQIKQSGGKKKTKRHIRKLKRDKRKRYTRKKGSRKTKRKKKKRTRRKRRKRKKQTRRKK